MGVGKQQYDHRNKKKIYYLLINNVDDVNIFKTEMTTIFTGNNKIKNLPFLLYTLVIMRR